MKKIVYIFISLTIIFNCCTEPFEHKINDFDDILVVQGLLTNNAGPYSVFLSKTLSLDSDSAIFVEDAIVIVIDQLGNVETLAEKSPGHYITSSGFKTVIGNEYQLHIETNDNLEYISDPVKLIQGPSIDSLYTVYREEYDFENNVNRKGVDIRINTENWDQGPDDYYFKWDYVETWELDQRWEGKQIVYADWSQLVEYRGGSSSKECWKFDYSSDIILANSSDYSSNSIIQKSINYLREDNYKPHYGYSILVKQFIINKQVYDFWKFLRENNTDNGSVLDNIPFSPGSNIECVNDDKKVFGYFDASYRSEKRLNIITPIEEVNFPSINEKCKSTSMKIKDYKEASLGSLPIFALNIDLVGGYITFTHQSFCVNCMAIADTETTPSYWIFK